jgi:hypothetical protein
MKNKNKLQIRNSTAEFLVFTRQAGEDGIEVRLEDETVWLTQKLMAVLFEADVRTINEHLGNVYKDGEQRREATVRKFRIVRIEGTRNTGSYRTACSSPTLTAISRKPSKAARNPNEKTRIQRQIDSTDEQRDKLVYDLYGLSADDTERSDEPASAIAIVEGRDKTN